MAVAVYTSLLTLDEAPSGTVTVQDAGTTNSRNIYTDTGLSVAATNPIPLDSSGRATQGIIYTAATAYKVIVKDSAGVTLYTRDNIDPGVPIGSGTLAIANGGTGSSTAEAALAALGGATAGELADVAADVAAVAGTLGSTERTHIATGTTAQRPSDPIEGDIRRNTSIPQWEGHDGTDWRTLLTNVDIAGQSGMETPTSTTALVSPGRMQYHPGVAKAVAFVTVSGGTPTLTWGHNVASVSDGGVGVYTINLTTAFSGTTYAVIGTPFATVTGTLFAIECSAKTTTSFTIKIYNAQGSADSDLDPEDNSFSVMAFGDQ
jgi:hypothetical protein